MIINKNIDGGKGFDWGLASEDYAKYRDIYPEEFYKRIVDLGYCTEGQTVLDLGTGTGVLPRNMYKYGAKFVGTDISENQIKYAKKLSKDMQIDYLVSSAEHLEFPENSFDVITACQCFIYFDKKVVMPKIYKLLKDNGHFLKLSMIWLPYESDIAMESEKLVLKYNPTWSGAGFRRNEPAAPEYSEELFTVENAIAFDIDVLFTRESWNGRMKACRGIGASLGEEEIRAWEREHMELLEKIAPAKFDVLHYGAIAELKVRKEMF